MSAKPILRSTSYASSEDFCRIFHEEIDGLYLLSFLLTADRGKAEQCFVLGLEDSVEGNPVFKEWARSWARRMIIQNAVQAVRPRPLSAIETAKATAGESDGDTVNRGQEQPAIEAVFNLAPFERFVYVLSILERLSDQECSVLMGCSRRDVKAARERALQKIGNAMEANSQRLLNLPQKKALGERCSSLLKLPVTLHLATSV